LNPLPLTLPKKQVKELINSRADSAGRKLGINRRNFLATPFGMTTTFLAMNQVYGPLFHVSAAEAAEPNLSRERREGLAKQFILDDKVLFVPNDYQDKDIIDFGKFFENQVPKMKDALQEMELEFFKFPNFLKEIFVDSDTKVGLLSSVLRRGRQLLSNDQISKAAERINSVAGGLRSLSHCLIRPGQPGWLEEVDRCIEVLRPTSWFGDPIGALLSPQTSNIHWRLDDEKLMYPFYEKIVKSGITTVCVRKGLLPSNYKSVLPDVWKYATVEDVPKAAKDWPQVSFVIYHAAQQLSLYELPDQSMLEFESTGYIPWVSDLAAIPEKFGVSNVYGELSTAFGVSAVESPLFCTAMLGTLIKGLGYDHVFWGTSSIFSGSPQWQIEAFRRIEIPEDMRRRYGFAQLDGADSTIKNAILGQNAARHYRIEPFAKVPGPN
jgi:uncharacterized protein